MGGGFTLCAALPSLCSLAPTEAVARRSKAERPRKQAPPGPADQVAERRIRDWLIWVPSSPAMYAKLMVDGQAQLRETDPLKRSLRCGTWAQSPPCGLGRHLTPSHENCLWAWSGILPVSRRPSCRSLGETQASRPPRSRISRSRSIVSRR